MRKSCARLLSRLALALLLTMALLTPGFAAAPTSAASPPQPPSSITEKGTVLGTGADASLLDSAPSDDVVSFDASGHAILGSWSATTTLTPLHWTPGAKVEFQTQLRLSPELWEAARALAPNINRVVLLVTAERDFDPQGLQHLPHDQFMSTLLTVTHLPIEGGGSSGAVSRYTGATYRTPVDVLLEIPFDRFRAVDASAGPPSSADLSGVAGWQAATITATFNLPKDLPPGVYRLRFDLGVRSPARIFNLNGDGIGGRAKDPEDLSCVYSPPITAAGPDSAGADVDGATLARHMYWILLRDYNSNGYRGTVALEDQDHFALSARSIIQDEIILPLYDANGKVLSYNLEPTFITDTMDPQRAFAYDYTRGEWSVKVYGPDGDVTDLGTASFVAKRGAGATTKNAKFTAWKPPMYGCYIVEARGWIMDRWGNRYEGGGTYSFWIAKRLTFATATFQGQPYAVGGRYGRDIGLSPGVPAYVGIRSQLFVNSDPHSVRTVYSSGRATQSGVFGVAQGMQQLPLDAPGEYLAQNLAIYWDPDGHLWVSTMRHAGVVYPVDSPIVAHGKKLRLREDGSLVDRGETHFEGYVEEGGDVNHLDHINFPFNAGDAILIASEQQGANKIEPVLTYETKATGQFYDPKLQGIGRTNVAIKTSNGLSPHMFPEYITEKAYFYGSAARPGFMSRFIVAEDGSFAPYWPTSRSNFGGQIGASVNGDMPGDIYRLLGGVVLRPGTPEAAYAGYMANGFILPKGSDNNRVVAPGSEDLPSPDGHPSRFFLVAVRPGMVYPKGAIFAPFLQIDPMVPADVIYTLTAPDGTVRTTTGKGDATGYFIAKDKWPLDQPGVWAYNMKATWEGHEGRMPGLPEGGGLIFVMDMPAPISDSDGGNLPLNMPAEKRFSPTEGFEVTGNSTADHVYFTAITPGAVLEEGSLPVVDGHFTYKFDPQKFAQTILTYDTADLVTGKPTISRVVHLTFFAEERGEQGTAAGAAGTTGTTGGTSTHWEFARLIVRGTTALYTKSK